MWGHGWGAQFYLEEKVIQKMSWKREYSREELEDGD